MSAREVGRFDADLSRFAQTLGGRLDELTVNVAFALGEMLVDHTAVDTGNARAHWWASVNEAAPAPLGPDEASGGTTVAPTPAPDFGPRLVTAHHGDVVTFENNAAYISYLEHGTPHMAAQPMLAPTLAAAPATVTRIARQMGGAAGQGRVA